MLYLAADHRGFALKETLKTWLLENAAPFKDMGALLLDINDDYPDFGEAAVQAVLQAPHENKAVLLCGSGHGMEVIANKFKGIRAALCFNTAVAKQSREHENANVLVLAADWVRDREAIDITKVWLETPFSNAERNVRRLEKLAKLEDTNFK